MALFLAAFLLIRRARAAIAISAALLFWLLAAGWLAAPLLTRAQPPDAPGTGPGTAFAARTAIILLGGGTEYNDDDLLIPKRDARKRIARTAQLYAQCRRVAAECTVIVSGGNPQRHTATEADTYLPWLLREHVARSDIILENRSLNTYENARNVAAILPHAYYDSLILVTSAYHMPRALLDFHVFGLAPQPAIANTRHAQRGVLPRYENLVGAELALHELIGIAQFRVYRALGWF